MKAKRVFGTDTPLTERYRSFAATSNAKNTKDLVDRLPRYFPGHGQELVGVKAWDIFRLGLESATRKMPGLEFGSPTYHIVPRKNLPAKLKATRDMVVLAIPLNVHVKGSPFDGKTYFLCVQMDSADGLPITKAAFEDGKLGRGSQLSVKYRVKNGEARKGLVWLK